MLRILGIRAGEKVLDIACGEGSVSRMIGRAGANVLAVDESPELISLAKKSGGSGVEYRVARAHDLGRVVRSGTFDAAVIVLALENIERYREALSTCAKALRKSGRLVLVLNHPSFRVPKRSSWQHDSTRRIMFRRVDGYLSESVEKIEMEPEKTSGLFVLAYHRPLQAYAKALERAGFLIERMEEWTSPRKSEGKRAEEENRARREFPLFLAIRAVKRSELEYERVETSGRKKEVRSR